MRTTTNDEDDLAAAPPRLGDQRLFFGFSIFPVCFSTKDFTRAHSFLTPLAKSRGPYSNSATKLKVKTMNRMNQKNPRRSAMQHGSRFEPCDQRYCYEHALTLPFIRRFRAKHSSLWQTPSLNFFNKDRQLALACAGSPRRVFRLRQRVGTEVAKRGRL